MRFLKNVLIFLGIFLLSSNIIYAADFNGADIAWVSICSALVMLMTPALGFFYAGLVRRKNLVSTLVQCLAIFAVVSLLWAFIGYTLVFGPSIGGFIGNISKLGLSGLETKINLDYAPTIPELLFFFFQLKFAAITPALIIGALVERINFKSLLIFVSIWAILVYTPIAHAVWNIHGWLRGIGAVDFAGGTVVHIAAGFSALAAATVLGRRKGLQEIEFKPSNVPYVILGASLLWFGWFGFNAGSALAANPLAVSALVTTNLAAAAAAISWMFVDWIMKGKPSGVGLAIGAVCGLVAITPASGYVGINASIIIGLVAGVLSNLVANWRSSRTRLDDSLDVFACHGISGVWGALATGLFATLAVNATGVNGLFYGNPKQLLYQAIAVAVSAAYSFVGSYIILKILNRFTEIRVTSEEEENGLDMSQHGEEAYILD